MATSKYVWLDKYEEFYLHKFSFSPLVEFSCNLCWPMFWSKTAAWLTLPTFQVFSGSPQFQSQRWLLLQNTYK